MGQPNGLSSLAKLKKRILRIWIAPIIFIFTLDSVDRVRSPILSPLVMTIEVTYDIFLFLKK